MTDRAHRWVLLLRGINVNPTTRVAMADLRRVLSELGFTDVETLLQSGNVLVTTRRRPAVETIEAAIARETGVRSKLVVLSLAEFEVIAAANPLLTISDDLSKLVVTFLAEEVEPATVERPTAAELAPERLVIHSRAVYQWCPDGILQSKLTASWWRQFGPVVTARNVRTVNRILGAAK